MKYADIDGVTLEYDVSGDGEPVLCLHGALIADAFRPQCTEPSLAGRYRLILYNRRGYGGSSHPGAPTAVADHVADCRALLSYLGIDRAHVAGHSYGGSIALQLALDFPEIVHSLALLEPALFGEVTGQAYRDALAQGELRFREADADVVIDEFLRARNPAYRQLLNQEMPGSFAQTVTDAGTWFVLESPGIRTWTFGEQELRQIEQPILSLLGGASQELSPRFGEVHQMLLSQARHAEGHILPGATHLMQVEDPSAVAEAMSSFFARHPL